MVKIVHNINNDDKKKMTSLRLAFTDLKSAKKWVEVCRRVVVSGQQLWPVTYCWAKRQLHWTRNHRIADSDRPPDR